MLNRMVSRKWATAFLRCRNSSWSAEISKLSPGFIRLSVGRRHHASTFVIAIWDLLLDRHGLQTEPSQQHLQRGSQSANAIDAG
jgi:hypothetical protein